jgi:hypothetical protein
MHGYETEIEFLASMRGFLGAYYLTVAILNVGAAWLSGSRARRAADRSARRRGFVSGLVFSSVALLFLVQAFAAFSGRAEWTWLLMMPASLRDGIDRLMGPVVFVVGSTLILSLCFLARRYATLPAVAWMGLNVSLLLMGLSLSDRDFAAIVAKPDNVPIVGMIFLLGFFTWLAARKAVLNDARLAAGQTPLEAVDNENVLVWPDLVYIELICMVILTAVLLAWSILLKAPLEEPASTVLTPNPSKAPWYFLGLQEMLVYFDPWMAGVAIPVLITIGLIAIPYLDRNPRGNGYYTINERQFAYVTFQFGFLVLWIVLMLMGTFFRGPNWSFFGFYETWDVHKVEALNNVQLSERFWTDWLGKPLPVAAAGVGGLARFGAILLRESPGLVLLAVYYLIVPGLMTRTVQSLRRLRAQLGRGRYVILMFLLLTMGLLPVKMLCRWLFNMNYFVSIPEYFLNF